MSLPKCIQMMTRLARSMLRKMLNHQLGRTTRTTVMASSLTTTIQPLKPQRTKRRPEKTRTTST